MTEHPHHTAITAARATLDLLERAIPMACAEPSPAAVDMVAAGIGALEAAVIGLAALAAIECGTAQLVAPPAEGVSP